MQSDELMKKSGLKYPPWKHLAAVNFQSTSRPAENIAPYRP